MILAVVGLGLIFLALAVASYLALERRYCDDIAGDED